MLRRLAILLLLLVQMGTPAYSQFVHARGTEIVDASGKPLQFVGSASGTGSYLKAISGVSADSARRNRNLS
jgi:hypothetical protein